MATTKDDAIAHLLALQVSQVESNIAVVVTWDVVPEFESVSTTPAFI
jgi:hypothetical protein